MHRMGLSPGVRSEWPDAARSAPVLHVAPVHKLSTCTSPRCDKQTTLRPHRAHHLEAHTPNSAHAAGNEGPGMQGLVTTGACLDRLRGEDRRVLRGDGVRRLARVLLGLGDRLRVLLRLLRLCAAHEPVTMLPGRV